VAEQGDAEQHPIWVYNLIESRAVILQVRGRKRVILVKTVSTEMRTRVWDRCVEWYPDDTLY
ncbi:MAG: nitroreductase/quinone reductase family protein, partial [Pseudomonadales bacterium]|nr:nitroreductase/quinone reductase family protein [Pseudomonadales bacterium]